MSLLSDYRDRRLAARLDDAEGEAIEHAWHLACIGAGLSTRVDTVTGPTEITPRIVDGTLGPPPVFTVELLHGQVPSDVRALAYRLAPSLAAKALRIEPVGHRHVRVVCLDVDPLVDATPARGLPVETVHEDVTVGNAEDGTDVRVNLAEGAHIIVQGSTGSGKSTLAYGLLGQLRDAPDAWVVGSDITGRTLLPWRERGDLPASLYALGTRDIGAHVTLLESLVDRMDERVERIPRGHDALPITVRDPLMVVVLEELAGLLRLAELLDAKLAKRIKFLYGRLMAESRKAAMRVLLLIQRADADIIGGFARDQTSHTFSFRVGSLAALRMLHLDVDAPIAAAHSTADPGVVFMSAPGVPLRRFKAPHTKYATYDAEIGSAA